MKCTQQVQRCAKLSSDVCAIWVEVIFLRVAWVVAAFNIFSFTINNTGIRQRQSLTSLAPAAAGVPPGEAGAVCARSIVDLAKFSFGLSPPPPLLLLPFIAPPPPLLAPPLLPQLLFVGGAFAAASRLGKSNALFTLGLL